jgi:hypothetical protein
VNGASEAQGVKATMQQMVNHEEGKHSISKLVLIWWQYNAQYCATTTSGLESWFTVCVLLTYNMAERLQSLPCKHVQDHSTKENYMQSKKLRK